MLQLHLQGTGPKEVREQGLISTASSDTSLSKMFKFRYPVYIAILFIELNFCQKLTVYQQNTTVNSRLADTSLLRTPRYYGQQQNPRRKLQTLK